VRTFILRTAHFHFAHCALSFCALRTFILRTAHFHFAQCAFLGQWCGGVVPAEGLPTEVRAEATCRPLCRAPCSDMRSGALDIRGAPLLLAVESVAARVSRARAAVWVPGRFSLLSTPTAADC
jgi:hypothetical protein